MQFPTIDFKSRSVASAGKDTLEVMGDLTLHGVTRPVTLKVVRTGSGTMMGKSITGLETSFFIKRSEYGMTKMVGPVADDVWINVSIEAIKQ